MAAAPFPARPGPAWSGRAWTRTGPRWPRWPPPPRRAPAGPGAPSPDEDRRFRAHITLARLRAPADVRPLTAELAGLQGPPWTAGRIQLIHSRLPEPGAGRTPVYTSLAAWPLA